LPDSDHKTTRQLQNEVAELHDTLALIEKQRQMLVRRQRRHLLIVGIGTSLLVHLCIMYYLASNYRIDGGAGGPAPVSYEFAILQEEELTELEATELDDLIPDASKDFDDVPTDDAMAELDPTVPSAELEVAASGSMPTLGGAGDGTGGDGSLAGGGAGASFFGVSSRGTRFAYIVDRSGSMGQGRKLPIAMRELARSIGGLPDYASFYVLLFSSAFIEPPMQHGWMRARRSTVNRFIRWLNDVDPSGGTIPMPAFHQVFSLDVRPDVLFFLTDGEIPDDTAKLVADLNRRGGRVVINTIAFGNAQSQDLLKQIARESGGVYRFVSSEGN